LQEIVAHRGERGNRHHHLAILAQEVVSRLLSVVKTEKAMRGERCSGAPHVQLPDPAQSRSRPERKGVHPMGEGPRWPWKRATGIIPGSDLTGVTELDLIDVTLLTESAGEAVEVPHLGLFFDSLGMTVKKPNGVSYARVPWVSIVQLSANAVGARRHELSTAVALDVQSKKKHHHFVVPNVQPDALTGSLGAMSERYGRGELVLGGPTRGMRRH
jgi:hypothetical protein